MATRTKYTLKGKSRDSYLELVLAFPLASIKSDKHLTEAQKVMDRLFEPFVTSKEQGMGMGLSISRSIVDAHGGRLWLAPNRDRGCTFLFTLPLSQEQPVPN